jgi:hypothetical protein
MIGPQLMTVAGAGEHGLAAGVETRDARRSITAVSILGER